VAFWVAPGTKRGLGQILVVDDQEQIRTVVAMTLTRAGYAVMDADDGGKVSDVLNTGDNQLMADVFMGDIRMPKINGVEAIAYFGEQYPSVPHSADGISRITSLPLRYSGDRGRIHICSTTETE